jgi:hypothetical protein
MQFGRLMGGGLMLLGILLIGIQLTLGFGHKKEGTSYNDPGLSSPRDLPVPVFIGAALLIGGAVTFAMARRRDEPDPEHAVK